MPITPKKEFRSIITPVFRASFPAVFQAALPANETDEKKAKFSVTMLFDVAKPEVAKGVEEMKAFARVVGEEAWGKDLTKWPHIEYKLFRSGEEPAKADKAGYGKNIIFARASSSLYKKNGEKRMPPGIVDAYGKAIIDPSEFYGGCYARAKLTAYTYSYMGKTGISFGLISLRKERDGEKLASTHNAADDFEGIPMPEGVPAAEAAAATAATGGASPF